MPRLALFVFGAPRIERNGAPVAVDTRKALALLAYLALTGKPQARDTLAALLWPDYGQTQARATLRRTLSALNKALDAPALDASRETINLNEQSELWTDVGDFLAHLAACQPHNHAPGEECDDCLRHLTSAEARYTDDFLAGFGLRDSETFEEWQFFQREDLKRRLNGALERLVAAHTRRGAYEEAIHHARRWLALDRLHEPAHRALMESYALSSQYAAALHQYRECVQTLDSELGVPPLEATTQLYEAILKRRLQPPATSAPATPPSAAPASVALTPRPAQPPRPRVGVLPLMGRADELARLARAYDAATTVGQLVVLDGEAGIGKTRLAGEFLAGARRRGATIIEARCYTGEAYLAYGPIVAALRSALAEPGAAARLDSLAEPWLAEAARLAPELQRARPSLPAPPPLDGPGAQARFFEGICQTLYALCGGPNAATHGVFFVDDAQWADSASLDVLTYLVRRPQTFPLFTLLCWRRPEAANSQRLRTMLAEARRSGSATVIALDRLAFDATRELVRASLPPDDARLEVMARRLHEETEGVPVFLVEYLAAARNGLLAVESDDWAVPGAMRDALLARVHAVSETGWQALTAAAVIGRSFDVDILRVASGRSEDETVAALDELSASGLVSEARDSLRPDRLTYDFGHEKVRAVVQDEISLARQRLLHRRIAVALVARNPRDLGALAVQIAGHYRAAGQESEAAMYFKLAGERARALYANSEALAHLETALALGHPDAAGLHEAIGDLNTLLGSYSAALRSYETAAALSPEKSVARLEWKLSGVYARRGDWGLAESHLASALTAWGESGPAAERAHAYAGWSLIARRQGDAERAQELASLALALAQRADDPSALAQAHNVLGALASGAGHYDEALRHLEQSLGFVERLDDPSDRIAALNNLSLLRAARGEAAEARRLAEEALALCVAQGDRHREAALRNNLADRLREAGDLEGAIAHLTEAVRIFAEIGADTGDLQPEIWKLTEW
ncbi:MAG TPA: AAA family ATPase [Ktedonobacterales bacterium]|nr:AAA family ATPase [Ktedonobacterales bacterium]